MTQVPEYYKVLAEAVSPLSHSLTAGLLIRPVPGRAGKAKDDIESEEVESATTLCLDLDRLLKESVPIMKQAMSDLRGCSEDELEELVDELAAPALDLVDMSRRI